MHLPTRLILILTFYYSVYNTAQYKPSINYTTSNGLPNNAVRALFLDKNEDLWIGTENGISKLENRAFSNLILPKTIKNNSCWDIAQDRNGNLWFASYGGGVYKYDVLNFLFLINKRAYLFVPQKICLKKLYSIFQAIIPALKTSKY
jgi:ligand-binding sensor domain-containing protein